MKNEKDSSSAIRAKLEEDVLMANDAAYADFYRLLEEETEKRRKNADSILEH